MQFQDELKKLGDDLKRQMDEEAEGLSIIKVLIGSCVCRLERFFARNWALSVTIDIPNVDIAISINLGEDCWMNR